MTRAKQIAQRLAEAAMFIPGPLTKHHSSLLLVRRDDIANMLLDAGLQKAVEALEVNGHQGHSPVQCRQALTALEGKLVYSAADDPEIRAALQRTVNGDG